MKPEAEVDMREFERSLVRYKAATRKAWPVVIRDQARLLLTRVLRLTPPKTQAQGRARVAGDILRVYKDFGNVSFDAPSIQKAWRANDYQALQTLLGPDNFTEGLRLEKEVNPGIHQSARKVRGRVSDRRKPHVGITGRGKLRRYISQVQRRVGIAKAGWAHSMIAVGGKLPAWINRHGTGYGEVNDESRNRINPGIELINKVSHMKDLNTQKRIVASAIQGRSRDIARSAEHQLRKATRRAQL